ncbi:hypothetical protein VOLCADRAFT_98120 [Volvox carteri f. nagariensis]|uniref:Uncharacterized protein n=1 Tax=Volvox carteri f. nagariensis TaxID=3068 RepID=D8UEH8_VOLCA|nr:uncharacterized protein VOLCADRAFT_98120 [Volvox carteri f. nagariensis]EFJ41884.1 hypothetical protein VOLCADRAFT_98120 [Volvox carteri f. nagariensis]|eukprot:XP_002957082.1 hypothetical protein VOLCADRAFT_98120 [Volvox carteri f. nagariensis]
MCLCPLSLSPSLSVSLCVCVAIRLRGDAARVVLWRRRGQQVVVGYGRAGCIYIGLWLVAIPRILLRYCGRVRIAPGCGDGYGGEAVNFPAKTESSRRSSASGPSTLVTLEEVQLAAQRRGLHVGVKEFGLFYRVVCRDGGEDGRILGVTNGFVAPWFGIMHCDTLQIFTRGLKGDTGQRIRGGTLGLGLLLGGATFAHGFRRGCRTAEILAINDDDDWHERLVKYYSYFGFRPVCRVGGNGLADVPHMLVWGGEGTRMDADIGAMLRSTLSQAKQKRNSMFTVVWIWF